MAPVKAKKSKTASEKRKLKTDYTTTETKERAKAAIKKLKAKDSKDSQALVAKLEAALEKGDDINIQEINEDIDAMDVDEENNEGGEGEKAGPAAEGGETGQRGEGNGKDDEGEKGENDKKEGEKQDKYKATVEDEEKGEDKGSGKDKGKGKDNDGKGDDKGRLKPNIKKEPQEDSRLFMSDAPESGKEEEEEEEEEVDPEYGRPLYRRHDPKLGDIKTVGWVSNKGTMFVNQYGPKNAAIHRLNRFADSPEYEDDLPHSEKVSNPRNRRGDEILPNGNLTYTRRHIIAIYGVAWAGNGSSDDLDLIDPELVETRWPGTYILVAWDILGTIRKTWETRQCLRARWGKAEADIAIFEAACEAQERYGEVESGRRRATSRSPSVGLVSDTVRKQRDMSLGADRPSSSRAKSSTPSRTRSPAPSRARSPTPSRTRSPAPSRTRSPTPSRTRSLTSRSRSSTTSGAKSPTPSRSRTKTSTPPRSRAKNSIPPSRVRFSDSDDRDDVDSLAEELEEFRLDYLECAGVRRFRDLDPEDKKDFITTWQLRKAELY